jgi:2-isopropylmalate synthase
VNSRRIRIFDTTLRDGEQAPGIALRPEEKVVIAEQLEQLGVDVIEAGFAASSPGDLEGVRAVAQTVQRATVASLCRTNPEDIDVAAAALAGAPRSRLHVFIATSAVHMEKKLRLRPDEVVARAAAAIERACAAA